MKFCDDGFLIDLGYFGHFRGTTFVWGGSQLFRFLLELEDWIPAGEMYAGAGAEAGGQCREFFKRLIFFFTGKNGHFFIQKTGKRRIFPKKKLAPSRFSFSRIFFSIYSAFISSNIS